MSRTEQLPHRREAVLHLAAAFAFADEFLFSIIDGDNVWQNFANTKMFCSIFRNRAFSLLLTMTVLVRNLIFSHIIVFAAGVTAGKLIDADELNIYREVHESSFTRFRRKAAKIALGTAVLGTVVLIARMSSRRSSKN
jgi:hypothetical protein